MTGDFEQEKSIHNKFADYVSERVHIKINSRHQDHLPYAIMIHG